MRIELMELARWLVILGLWGMWGFLPRLAVATIPPATALFAEVLAGGTLAVGVLVFALRRGLPCVSQASHSPLGKACMFAFLAGVCGYSGIFAYINAITKFSLHFTSILTGLYPVLTVILGVVVLGERPRPIQWVGIALALLALALVVAG